MPLKTREAVWGFAFILPWLLGFVLFSLGPIVGVFYFSLTEYSVFDVPRWVGLANYARMLREDELFWQSSYNTLYYVALRVPLHVGLGFLLALLLHRNLRGIGWFRTAFYLPAVMPIVATAVIWMWLFQPNVGVVNYLLELLGLPKILWLTSDLWAKPAIVLISLWHVGPIMVIFLAGLNDIPDHLYEAASIDGAGRFRRLLYITIPMMTPVLFFNLIMDVINSFQVFAFAFIMTQGGPLNSTLFTALYIYQNAFQYFEMGYASALSVVLFLVILGFTVIIVKSQARWVHYERL
ncbi:MAG: sugar ABC transporter permease [Candidatus Rokubacteria bacterium]|nr:sugar ABC transporter permease [Candidatus Rokubacteria bacterium]